jgi:hypothetical protein
MKLTQKATSSVIKTVKTVVPKHFRDRDGSSQRMGSDAEQLFQQKCIQQAIEWRPSNKQENMIHHIDCYVKRKEDKQEISVDVKACKKLMRWHPKCQDKLIWVEWMGRSGKPGWARSPKLDYVAFEMLSKHFLMVKRQELEDFVAPLIEKNRGIRPNTGTDARDGIIYRRAGNKDELTLLKSKDLVFLPSSYLF